MDQAMDIIDEIKTLIPDQKYMDLMNALKRIHDASQKNQEESEESDPEESDPEEEDSEEEYCSSEEYEEEERQFEARQSAWHPCDGCPDCDNWRERRIQRELLLLRELVEPTEWQRRHKSRLLRKLVEVEIDESPRLHKVVDPIELRVNGIGRDDPRFLSDALLQQILDILEHQGKV